MVGGHERIRNLFSQQKVMQELGAEISRIASGELDISMPFNEKFTQQNGFLHAGIVSTLLDSACGGAALTKIKPGNNVLAVEFKINFLAPASGDSFIASGRVIKAGRTISVCEGEAFAFQGIEKKLVARMQATMISIHEK